MNTRPYVMPAFALTVAASLVLSACGGGGGGGSSSSATTPTTTTTPAAATSISGVAAAGAPIPSGIGYALDASTGTKIPFTTGTDGTYSLDLAGKTGPFLIHVRGITSGGAPVNVYSLATTSSFGNTVNITPLSDIVVGYAAGQTTAQLEAACTATLANCPTLFNGLVANLALSTSQIMGAIPASVLAAFSVDPATFNPISTSFTPNHSGADGLLDALQVVPPTNGGTTYAINLNAATPVPLVTVPVAGTASTPTPNASAPTTASVAQSADLAKSLAEVQAAIATFNQDSVAAAPGFPAASTIAAGLDPSFLMNGLDGATFSSLMAAGSLTAAGTKIIAGSVSPYAYADWATPTSGPAANVTYDANNCVTSLWSNFGTSGMITDSVQYKKTITNPTGCVGTWKFAGNQKARTVELLPYFEKQQSSTGDTVFSGFHLSTASRDTSVNTGQLTGVAAPATPYASVTITGPGLTTAGAPNTTTSGTVTLVPPTLAAFNAGEQQNQINDAYYSNGGNGTSVLEDCGVVVSYIGTRATTATPCYNSNAVAGSDYVVKFLAPTTSAVIATTQVRLLASLGAASLPMSWYPTITSVTPTAASSVPTGNSNVSYNFTVPTGGSAHGGTIRLFDNAGGVLFTKDQPVTTSTSNTVPVTGLGTVPTTGWVGMIAPIAGLKVGTGMSF